MGYRDLRDFLSQLERSGELKRVRAEVDPYLEMTEVCDRVLKSGGPALLFEKPKGHSIPVLGKACACAVLTRTPPSTPVARTVQMTSRLTPAMVLSFRDRVHSASNWQKRYHSAAGTILRLADDAQRKS